MNRRSAPATWAARLLRGDRLVQRFVRFVAASAVSTVTSQLTLTGLYWLGGTSAAVAGVVAFVAGAVPNYLLNRRFAWRRHGRPALRGEVLPYIAVIVTGGLAAVGMTTAMGWLVEPVIHHRAVRSLLLSVAYQSSYGVLFVIKFAVLDRLVFRGGRARTRATTS